jgi:preprotein translocase subunit YajC
MNDKSRPLAILLVCLISVGLEAQARERQDTAPAQKPDSQQSGNAPQRPRGEGRGAGLFGKLTAIHDQSIEIATYDGGTVTVKIGGDTQFRKEREAAKLSDFKVGDVVFVRGQENPDHSWTAQLVGTPGAGAVAGGPGGGPGGFGQMGVLGKDYLVGEVKAIDAPKLTILRQDNVTQTIELNEDASLRKGRESITMADIQPGDHVVVRGAMSNEVFVPKNIFVIPPEQWKRMQEIKLGNAPPPNAPKGESQPQKPAEPPH